ncbi:MAG TPA: hypothetical protein PLL30_16280, partial [Candidatus Krumholzibacteria bacterium]|nr:hypothetical protein [Candidatus Krumholzibacteria bacterium]HPD73329.1 hypothetical protein [Candidatus Krumholzibacteria bacterium]HRY42150.1 hypothetical protein [Candidatus Krumholzibacteria bacterium]
RERLSNRLRSVYETRGIPKFLWAEVEGGQDRTECPRTQCDDHARRNDLDLPAKKTRAVPKPLIFNSRLKPARLQAEDGISKEHDVLALTSAGRSDRDSDRTEQGNQVIIRRVPGGIPPLIIFEVGYVSPILADHKEIGGEITLPRRPRADLL